ncbi:MAG: ATP-dependent Clp protease ATP-binding subunit [Patescibacteria group bacterium]|nr:ATP-dependent Clp protease ATP-binding subunit [Patescibacteria group bacterium]
MHKRLTTNVHQAIAKAKKLENTNDLKKINSLVLLQIISTLKGSLGKTLLESFNIKQKDIFTKKNTPGIKQNMVSVLKILSIASRIAYSSRSPYIGTEHFVYGFMTIPTMSSMFMIKKEPKNKISRKDSGSPDFFGEAHSLIDNFFSAESAHRNQKESLLESYCADLTKLSKIDHSLIGRQHELERISHILGRKMKNNPVLIGEPGVGKTAIVEGLAQRINLGTAPYFLSEKRILSLDLGLLIAGSTFRGEFEARLKELVNELKQNTNVILFIDEIHNLIGAGNAVGGMDAASLLKPALSRGEIQVIGATTIDEYQKHIEKDSALERRFQPIFVEEPEPQQAVEILEGIKSFYEKYHNVKIEKDATSSAVTLAKHYITDRYLPDSAIDLIDETAARLRSQSSNGTLFAKMKKVEQKHNRIVDEKEQLVMSDQYERAIRIRQEEKTVLAQLQELKKKHKRMKMKNPITITEEDIRQTLSFITNIPQQLLSQKERSLANNVKKTLSNNLIGQSHVNHNVHQTVLRQVSGITNPHRPLGSFLFIGPTGVGKTYAAKLLSEAISPKKSKSLIQINMSEFSERHNISRLLGAPAGYVGYEEGGELSDRIRRNPHSVVLFDEIEKAQSSVLNILLQILEEGEIVDAKGRLVNFRNTIVILTSNIGTHELDQASKIGFEHNSEKAKNELKEAKKTIQNQLNELLAPELLNRLDNTMIFNPLQKNHIKKIVGKELETLTERLRDRKISLSVQPEVLSHLTNQSVDWAQGARLVRRILQEKIEPIIAEKILNRKNISSIQITLEKNKLLAQVK